MVFRRFFLTLFVSAVAWAHTGSLTYGNVRIGERDVHYELRVPGRDMAEPLGLPADTQPTRDRVLAGKDLALEYVAERIAVLNNDRECAAQPAGLSIHDKSGEFWAVMRLLFECERRTERVEIRYALFFDLDSNHQSFTKIEVGGLLRQHVFRTGTRTVSAHQDVSVWDHARDYLVLGIEHIFTGYDHICFLIGLLLIAAIDRRAGGRRGFKRGVLYTLAIVTAFTIAHSITLIAAALGVLALPSRLVESIIAASIVYVAVENIVAQEPRRRWLLAFVFGLVHGFGFAGILAEIGLPRRGLVLSLVSFNVGVEAGQAAIVALVFPILHVWAMLRSYRRVVVVGGSALIALLGLLWFLERVFAIEILEGFFG